jgi:hypothetical protein
VTLVEREQRRAFQARDRERWGGRQVRKRQHDLAPRLGWHELGEPRPLAVGGRGGRGAQGRDEHRGRERHAHGRRWRPRRWYARKHDDGNGEVEHREAVGRGHRDLEGQQRRREIGRQFAAGEVERQQFRKVEALAVDRHEPAQVVDRQRCREGNRVVVHGAEAEPLGHARIGCRREHRAQRGNQRFGEGRRPHAVAQRLRPRQRRRPCREIVEHLSEVRLDLPGQRLDARPLVVVGRRRGSGRSGDAGIVVQPEARWRTDPDALLRAIARVGQPLVARRRGHGQIELHDRLQLLHD